MNKELRLRVWNKYGERCAYCGKDLLYEEMQVDHLIPKARYHQIMNFDKAENHLHSFENLMPSCRRCNHYKRALSLNQFRVQMFSLYQRVEKQYIVKVALDYGIIKIEPFKGVFYFEEQS